MHTGTPECRAAHIGTPGVCFAYRAFALHTGDLVEKRYTLQTGTFDRNKSNQKISFKRLYLLMKLSKLAGGKKSASWTIK